MIRKDDSPGECRQVSKTTAITDFSHAAYGTKSSGPCTCILSNSCPDKSAFQADRSDLGKLILAVEDLPAPSHR
jgi:hypothetical protein